MTREVLVPRPGIEPTPPKLESEILTTGPPEKSLFNVHNTFLFHFSFLPFLPGTFLDQQVNFLDHLIICL